MADILILIPARMASTRLPGKPLAEIAGEPMIVHVLRRAQAAGIGPVVVATDSAEIAAAVDKSGGRAVMTRADHLSGSDRIFEALGKVDPAGRAKIVVNVQGDLPTLKPADIAASLAPLADAAVDIATLAAEITKDGERTNPNVVKVPPSPLEQREKLEQLRALEAGMRIDVAIVDTVPLGVDTPEDLETARAMLNHGLKTQVTGFRPTIMPDNKI